MIVNDDAIMPMFEAVHGKITGSCYAEVTHPWGDGEIHVVVKKDGVVCWDVSLPELVFDYVASTMKEKR